MAYHIVLHNDTKHDFVQVSLFYDVSKTLDKTVVKKGTPAQRPRTGVVYIRWSSDPNLPDPTGSKDKVSSSVVPAGGSDYEYTFSKHPEGQWP